MVGSIDINVDEFWETSVGFLKSVVSQLFPKYSQKYDKIQLSLKSRHVVLVFSIWISIFQLVELYKRVVCIRQTCSTFLRMHF